MIVWAAAPLSLRPAEFTSVNWLSPLMVTLLVVVRLRLLTVKGWSMVAVPPVVAKFRLEILAGNWATSYCRPGRWSSCPRSTSSSSCPTALASRPPAECWGR